MERKKWHYRIKDVIGCGGYGTVFSAIDLRNNTPVAIKREKANVSIYLLHNI